MSDDVKKSLVKTLDLRKEKVLDLKKKKGLQGQKAAVILVLDYSYSMQPLYNNGKVQELVERILPLGLAFDDNGEVDFYLFHSGSIKVPENITMENVFGYINKRVIGKYEMGGTNYAPVINNVIDQFFPRSGGRFFGLGKPKRKEGTIEDPVYVIFITDGENGDENATEDAIRQASKHGIFFQFIGIGDQQFYFLQKLDDLRGRNIDNANFFTVPDLARKSDDELYELMLNEFPSFITEARQLKLIK